MEFQLHSHVRPLRCCVVQVNGGGATVGGSTNNRLSDKRVKVAWLWLPFYLFFIFIFVTARTHSPPSCWDVWTLKVALQPPGGWQQHVTNRPVCGEERGNRNESQSDINHSQIPWKIYLFGINIAALVDLCAMARRQGWRSCDASLLVPCCRIPIVVAEQCGTGRH